MIKKSILAIFAAVILSLSANAKEIIIYHTSDIHGYYFNRNLGGKQIGGFDVFKAFLSKEKKPYFLIDSGDWSTGTYEGNHSKGKESLKLMNMLWYNFITVGNHDFDLGNDLNKTLDVFKGEVLVANMSGFSTKKPVKPYAIVKRDGVKIAFIGFGIDGPGIDTTAIKIKDPQQTLKQVLAEVKQHNPDIVILIAHDSVLDSRKPSFMLGTIKNVEGAADSIDLVFGGHAHKRGATSPIENGPLFVESGEYLGAVSKAVIDVDDKTNKIISVKTTLTDLDKTVIGSDKKIEKYLAKIENKELDKIAGKLNFNLNKYPEKNAICADASGPDLIANYARDYGRKTGYKTQIGVFTIPSVRRSIPQGPLTGREVIEFLPYPEYMSSVAVPGSFFRTLVQDTLRNDDTFGVYSLFSYSDNVKVTFSYDEAAAKFTVSKITVDGQDLKDDVLYNLYILSNLVEGYFEGAPFKKLPAEYKAAKVVTDKSSGQLFTDLLQSAPEGLNESEPCRIRAVADVSAQ